MQPAPRELFKAMCKSLARHSGLPPRDTAEERGCQAKHVQPHPEAQPASSLSSSCYTKLSIQERPLASRLSCLSGGEVGCCVPKAIAVGQSPCLLPPCPCPHLVNMRSASSSISSSHTKSLLSTLQTNSKSF